MAEIVNMRVGGNLQGLIDLVNYINKTHDTKELTLLEIGSFKGESSEIFAKNFKKITCVDSWVGASVEMYLKTCTPEDIETAFDERMKVYDNVEKIKLTSKEAVEKIKNKFDVIYIDAAHDYNNVIQDITLWKDRAKLIICGHDYNKNHKGVIKAVNQCYEKPDMLFKDSSWIIWQNKGDIYQRMQEKWDRDVIPPFDITKWDKGREDNHIKYVIENSELDFKDKIILDYGCGGAWLGKTLISFGVKFYNGLDISRKNINFAKENMKDIENKKINAVKGIMDFSKYNADIFICVDCIKHFPNVEYVERFLKSINESGCKNLILNTRSNKSNTLAFIEKDVFTWVCYLPKNWIDKYLSNYIKKGCTNYTNGYNHYQYSYYEVK
jgi:2-polyprenyl-3-methyl-5-hydroxy-6-metoxy-1,4-benzoquinol methylase